MDRIAWKDKVLEFLKKYRYAVLILLLGLVLMSLPPMGGEEEQPPATEPQPVSATLEQRLEDILSQIQGAGSVRVMLTQQTGERYTYQTDEDLSDSTDGSSARRDTVIITDADRAQQGLIRQVDPPVYLGAVVVCQGADSASVRLAIVEAVSNATGLGADKISVLKMK